MATNTGSYTGAITGTTISSQIDVHHPYYLSSSDNPGMSLTTVVLNEHNYSQWSRSMEIALSSKLKLGFVDGTNLKPITGSPLLPYWNRCNHMVLRTLTRLAYFSADYASFIIENGALQGALAVFEPIFPSHKKIKNLAKFLQVVVRQVQVPYDKVGAVVTILDTILKEMQSNLRCIVRACYTLSYIAVELWVNEGNILNNIIDLILDCNDMISSSALRVAANIVKSKNSREILTKNYKFLRYLGFSEICCKPKKFQKEACHIISNMAANGGTSIKDLDEFRLMNALFKLLEVDDFDVRMGAAGAIHSVISCHRYELASMKRDVTVS